MIDEKLYLEIDKYINDNYEEMIAASYKTPAYNSALSNIFNNKKEKKDSRREDNIKYIEEEASLDDDIVYNIRSEKLVDIIKNIDESFSDAIIRIIREKNLDDVEVYKSIDMDRRLFSKIRSDSNYKPSKETAIALCFALKLNIEESNSLLKKAGYVLSRSSVFDLIIQYFLENNIYDIYEIDEALLSFDQKTLIH